MGVGCSTQDLLTVWNFGDREREGTNPIAVCEAAMVPLALWKLQGHMEHREVIFFLDNTVSLYGMFKGVSNQEDVARSAFLAHILAAKAKCKLWFEFVESKSNWSDGISRDLGKCEFCRAHGIRTEQVFIPQEWWKWPTLELYQRVKAAC